MFFEVISQANIAEAKKFIIPYEYKCINLAQNLRLIQSDFDNFANRQFKGLIFFASKSDREILGIVFLTAFKNLLYCFPDLPSASMQNIIIEEIFSKTQIFSIMGEEKAGTVLENALKTKFRIKPSEVRKYYLFTAEKLAYTNTFFQIALKNCNTDLTFFKAMPNDASKLLELQVSYEETEVLTGGKKANRPAVMLYLSRSLACEHIFAAQCGQILAAKAGTNAQGFFWNQIGGVYTNPDFRNKGISSALVFHLTQDIIKRGKRAALFVNVKNEAAQHVYKKIGFKNKSFFKIAYF